MQDIQKRQLYIVDDHPLVRESLTALINRQPDLCVCGDAGSADKALREILALKPDLAIVDVTLGKHSGLELIKELRGNQSITPVVVLSMHEEDIYAQRCMRAGASAYVMKTEATTQVVNAIRQVLSSQIFLSDAVVSLFAQRLSGAASSIGRSPIAELSDRELLVFSLLGKGLATRLVARNMNVSVKTVHTYCARIKHKLHLSTAKELLREAMYWQDHGKESVG